MASPAGNDRLSAKPRAMRRTGWFSLARPNDDERMRFWLLVGCVAAQALTVAITWPLWQLRETPPHLPVFPLPQLATGPWMLLSLVLVVLRPRPGLVVHAAVLTVAALMDQMRLQPQVFVLVVLMAACVEPAGERFCRWFLAATWFWAGLHKLLSPDWLGQGAWWMVSRIGLEPESTYLPFAVAVGVGEIVLGLAACFRPRWAAGLCVALHFGIVIVLSPLGVNWNESVIPWNLATAAVGWWVMRRAARPDVLRWRWEPVLAAALMIYPIGFYGGWVDHGFAGVLYSDCLPRGLITHRTGTAAVTGWGELAVPFPNERRLLRQYFELVAEPGEKLHISDPRPWLDDQFFVLESRGRAREIDADAFRASTDRQVAGIGLDRQRSLFALNRAGARLLRSTKDGSVYAIEFPPEAFAREQLRYLQGLPNLQQVQLSGTAISDRDLQHLVRLRQLVGVELFDTAVTAEGLQQLRDLPQLQYLGHDSIRPPLAPAPPTR